MGHRLLLALCAFFALCGIAVAHPHIFIDAKAAILFNDAGELIGIRHSWTFDEAMSSWQIQGLDTNGDGITSSAEMQELADDNMLGLAEYQFYTSAGEGSGTLPMASMDDATFRYENGRTTLTFGIEPQGPYRIREALTISVADQEYYVAINFAGLSDVTLENAPPGCVASLEAPQEMPDDVAERLYALPPDVTRLPDDLAAALRGVQGGIVVRCTGGDTAAAEPASALEAVEAVAEAQAAPLPFGGPPAEPGFTLPRTGFLGWIAQLQAEFYVGLQEALDALKRDGNAFWVLGGLSFLYGVFHAAGPGHGKVVISSYMLANERQMRRGVLLSFLSALMQSVVAIAFVLVAVAALSLTQAQMAMPITVIERVSFALMALLGLWLVARKLFGFGHHHHAPPPDLAAKAHDHLHAGADAHGRLPDDPHYGHDHGHDQHEDDEHGHSHVVTPEAAGGDWREQLGVVLAVGMRPCSGALVVLVFAWTQGLLPAGIAAVLLMGLGTAITVSVLAVVAVSAKGLAGRLLGARSGAAGAVVWWLELAGAFAVLLFGLLLLLASL